MCQPCFPNKNPAIPFCGQGGIRTPEVIRQQIYSLPVLTAYLPTQFTPLLHPAVQGVEPFTSDIRNPSQGEPHIRLALCCSISWNRTKFLWIALQRVLCLRRPSSKQKEFICTSTQSWMWFPLLGASNTLICQQVSVYASPPELVEQVYMSITTSPVLWTRRELNPPRSPCKGVPPALVHAGPKYSSNL